MCDSSFAALELLGAVRSSVTMITRLRLDAALYKPAPERTCSTMGRLRSKGAALPKLAVLLQDHRQQWRRVCLQWWYSQNNREVELLTGTAVWYHGGLPVVPIRQDQRHTPRRGAIHLRRPVLHGQAERHARVRERMKG